MKPTRRLAASTLSLALMFSGVGVPLFIGARVVRADSATDTGAALTAKAQAASQAYQNSGAQPTGMTGVLGQVENGDIGGAASTLASELWSEAVSAWHAVSSWWSSLFSNPSSSPADKAAAVAGIQNAASQIAALGANPGSGSGAQSAGSGSSPAPGSAGTGSSSGAGGSANGTTVAGSPSSVGTPGTGSSVGSGGTPSSALPAGTVPPGALGAPSGLPTTPTFMPPGSVPPGTLPPGTLPPGALPPGALPPGALPPGTVPPGVPPVTDPGTVAGGGSSGNPGALGSPSTAPGNSTASNYGSAGSSATDPANGTIPSSTGSATNPAGNVPGGYAPGGYPYSYPSGSVAGAPSGPIGGTDPNAASGAAGSSSGGGGSSGVSSAPGAVNGTLPGGAGYSGTATGAPGASPTSTAAGMGSPASGGPSNAAGAGISTADDDGLKRKVTGMVIVMPRVKLPAGVDQKDLAKDPIKLAAYMKDVVKKVDGAMDRVIKNREIEELDGHSTTEAVRGEIDLWVIENPTWKSKKPRRFKVALKDLSEVELVNAKNGCTGIFEGTAKKLTIDEPSIAGEIFDLTAAHVNGVMDGLKDVPAPKEPKVSSSQTASKPTPAAVAPVSAPTPAPVKAPLSGPANAPGTSAPAAKPAPPAARPAATAPAPGSVPAPTKKPKKDDDELLEGD